REVGAHAGTQCSPGHSADPGTSASASHSANECTEAGCERARCNGTIVRVLGAASGLILGILPAGEIVPLEDVERLVGRRKNGNRRTYGFMRACAEQDAR